MGRLKEKERERNREETRRRILEIFERQQLDVILFFRSGKNWSSLKEVGLERKDVEEKGGNNAGFFVSTLFFFLFL